MSTEAQKDELKSNTTFCCQIVKLTAKDGFALAYCDTDRPLVIGGATYVPYSPVIASRYSLHEGLSPDSSQIIGPLDPEEISEEDVRSGRWIGGRVYEAFVPSFLDLSLGVVQEKNWFIGRATPKGEQFTFDLVSLSQALQQTIGDETSPTDRRRTLAETGISLATHTHAATVTAVTDRRRFTVNVVQADSYFKYGLATWTAGDNDGFQMEVKDNAGGVIELALPMRSDIEIGDTVTLLRGYDGSRESAKAIDPALVLGGEFEPEITSLQAVLKYPE